METKTLKISDILVDQAFNCRKEIRGIDVADLARSIEKTGLIQPVVVCPNPKGPQSYRLIAGFRRVAAHLLLNYDEILAVIRPTELGVKEAKIVNLSENLNRADLTILEEAMTLKELYDLGLTETEVAEEIGMSRGWVQIRFMLIKLPKDIQEEVEIHKFTAQQIRDLYQLKMAGNRDKMYEACRTIKDAKMRGQKNFSIRADDDDLRRMRKKREIFSILDHLAQAKIPAGLHTKALAWCAGEISTVELWHATKFHAVELGLDYQIPETSDDQ